MLQKRLVAALSLIAILVMVIGCVAPAAQPAATQAACGDAGTRCSSATEAPKPLRRPRASSRRRYARSASCRPR